MVYTLLHTLLHRGNLLLILFLCRPFFLLTGYDTRDTEKIFSFSSQKFSSPLSHSLISVHTQPKTVQALTHKNYNKTDFIFINIITIFTINTLENRLLKEETQLETNSS